jgi:hypothetical protein
MRYFLCYIYADETARLNINRAVKNIGGGTFHEKECWCRGQSNQGFGRRGNFIAGLCRASFYLGISRHRSACDRPGGLVSALCAFQVLNLQDMQVI